MDRSLVADTLAALCWHAARERFSALGLRADVFVDRAPVAIASILLADRDFDDAETDALWRKRTELADNAGDLRSWGELIDAADWWSECLAVFAVRRFAHEHARRWLPANLETAAAAIRSGAASPRSAIESLAARTAALDFAAFGEMAA